LAGFGSQLRTQLEISREVAGGNKAIGIWSGVVRLK
jgi:hypothetical protein